MEDNYKQADKKRTHFRLNLLASHKEHRIWTLVITVISFFISVGLSLVSSIVLSRFSFFIAFIVVFLIILINILFDIIGTAVTAADEAPFHSMASRKVYGARSAISLIRNADKVSNLCNDVIGDICGVISGSASAYLIAKLVVGSPNPETTALGLSISGAVAAMTVGGKALGKSIAIENSNYIIYKVAIVVQFLFGKFNSAMKKRK